MPGQGFRWSRERFDHEEKPPWGSRGRVLLEEEVGYKEYRFELVQTWSDQSLGRKTVAAERWTMGWESHLHRIHLCAALAGFSFRTSRLVQLAGDKLFHGPVDGAGVVESISL